MKKITLLAMIVLSSIGILNAQRNENVFVYEFGDIDIILLSDGQQRVGQNILLHVLPEMIEETSTDGTFPNAVNAFFVRTPEHKILVDAGLGKNIMENLNFINIHPEEIDIVLLTHLHGDHYSGMLRGVMAAFPNAKVYISGQEHDYWMNDEIMGNLSENDRKKFQGVRNFIKVYKDKIHLFTPHKIENIQQSLVNGVFAVESFGHTPGHVGFLLKSGNGEFLIWGDLAHAMDIQMPYPQVAVTYDENPEEAVQSREKILKYVSQRNIPIAGMHIAYPAMGVIESNPGGGYKYIPFK